MKLPMGRKLPCPRCPPPFPSLLSEEENEQDEAYQKIRKEFNLRRASEAALRKEARSRDALGHKRSLNKIRRDFLGYHLPGYYKIGKK
jgi:hypothetical protein